MAAATVQVNVRIEPALYAKVKRRAKQDAETVTAVVNAALAAYVNGGESK